MTTNHIDQLTEWWENAEPGIPGAGDTVIFDERHRSLGFHVTQASTDHPRGYDNARILARAPKPKPAWHDAVAVIASHVDSAHRSTWTPDPIVPGMWITDDDQRDATDLRDVTPLIEAKVTDEMVERASTAFWAFDGDAYESMPAALHAALGLDPA